MEWGDDSVEYVRALLARSLSVLKEWTYAFVNLDTFPSLYYLASNP